MRQQGGGLAAQIRFFAGSLFHEDESLMQIHLGPHALQCTPCYAFF